MGAATEHDLALVFRDAQLLDRGIVGEEGEAGLVLAAIELVEPDFGGHPIDFDQVANEVDCQAVEAQTDGLAEDKLRPVMSEEVEVGIARGELLVVSR